MAAADQRDAAPAQVQHGEHGEQHEHDDECGAPGRNENHVGEHRDKQR